MSCISYCSLRTLKRGDKLIHQKETFSHKYRLYLYSSCYKVLAMRTLNAHFIKPGRRFEASAQGHAFTSEKMSKTVGVRTTVAMFQRTKMD